MNPTEQQQNAERTELTNDAMASLQSLAEVLDSGEPDDLADDVPPQMQMMAQMDATDLLQQFRPMAAPWMDQHPDRLKAALARLHLETGALLEKHTDADPEDLV